MEDINANAAAGREKGRDTIKRRLAEGLPAYKTPLEIAAQDTKSLRKAINAKCYDCVGQDADPGWRDRVRYCPCEDCSLYPVRQYR